MHSCKIVTTYFWSLCSHVFYQVISFSCVWENTVNEAKLFSCRRFHLTNNRDLLWMENFSSYLLLICWRQPKFEKRYILFFHCKENVVSLMLIPEVLFLVFVSNNMCIFPGVWSAWSNSWLVMRYATSLACIHTMWNVLTTGLCEASHVHHVWSQWMLPCLQVMRPTSLSAAAQATNVKRCIVQRAAVCPEWCWWWQWLWWWHQHCCLTEPRLTKVEMNLEA